MKKGDKEISHAEIVFSQQMERKGEAVLSLCTIYSFLQEYPCLGSVLCGGHTAAPTQFSLCVFNL